MITAGKLRSCGWQQTNADKQSGRRRVAGAPVFCFLALLAGIVLPASEAASGAITIAGNGPELRVFDRLTRAFDKMHLGVVAEIRWDASFHPIAMVKSGEAEFAVAGEHDPDLVAVPIAWDGSPWRSISPIPQKGSRHNRLRRCSLAR